MQAWLTEEAARHRLERRLERARIGRPFAVQRPEAFSAGADLYVGRNCIVHCGGGPFGDDGFVRLGTGCWIEHNSVVWGMGGIEIGDHSGTGPGCMILSFAEDYGLEFVGRNAFELEHQLAPVRIGSDVKLYAGVIVAPGVTIGDGAVVGAGSVVTRDLPAWTVCAGAPAAPIRARETMRPRHAARARPLPRAAAPWSASR